MISRQMIQRIPHWWPLVAAPLALVAWLGLYQALLPLSVLVVGWLPIDQHSPLADSLRFFVYDTPKVLMLLVLVIFVMGVVRSFFSPEKTRAFLQGRRLGVANAAAAALGVVTPFCSCSAVPLFVGFVSAGVPLGVTFSFLIAAPLVNEVALGLLWALLGWKVALIYLVCGLAVAIVCGMVIGHLRLETWLEPWVRDVRSAPAACISGPGQSWNERLHAGQQAVGEILGKVWLWMVLGIAAGAGIHGYVPAELLAQIMGREAWWSVPAAVVLGVPIYANAAGIVPVVEALLGKGAALGTVLAFMMAVTALSFPEMVILRKVLTLRLLAVFVGIVTCGIVAIGLLFNRIL